MKNCKIEENASSIEVVFEDNEILETFSSEKYTDFLMEMGDKGKDLILNFENVEVIDSLFIGSIIILNKKLIAQDKQLILKNLNDFLRNLFEKLNMKQFV